jgi:hypothetical protein
MRDPRAATAFHEAGHAIVAWSLGVGVKGVSIVPDADSTGRCHHARLFRKKYPELDDSLRAAVRMQKNVMIALAGLIAKGMYRARSVRHYHAHADHATAVDIALHLTSSVEEAAALIKWLEIRTRNVLRLRWPMVERLAKELLSKDTLNGAELKRSLEVRIAV